MGFSAHTILSLALLGSASAFVPQPSSPRATRRFVLSEPVTIETSKAGDSSPTEVETPKPEAAKNKVAVSDPTPIKAKETKEETNNKEVEKELFFVTPVHPNAKIEPGRYDSIDYSIALPFFQRPPKLDGSHAGDYGFDPMGFTEDYDLYYMQECELRHARLAMLAVVGWPLSELIGPDYMLVDGRAPSVLNGFNPISGGIVLAAFAAIGAFDYATSLRRTADKELGKKHLSDMEKVWEWGVAGDYNFDPLGLYDLLGDDAQGRKALRELEISHGRWAMIGITAFAFLEALSGNPIVENNPLFHPNPLVPVAAILYFGLSQIYQISDVRKYPIRLEYTKDGEEIVRFIQRSLNGGQA